MEKPTQEIIAVVDGGVVDENTSVPVIAQQGTLDEGIKELIPQMNVSLPAEAEQRPPALVNDDAMMGIWQEILGNFREDRKEIKDCFVEFKEMVINGGDSSTSSKEALVNLLKIQTETTDKMSKIADLMYRAWAKVPDTYKPYLTAKQENNTTINITNSKRQLLKSIEAAAKKAKEQNNE